jgi:hypothetical protein
MLVECVLSWDSTRLRCVKTAIGGAKSYTAGAPELK